MASGLSLDVTRWRCSGDRLEIAEVEAGKPIAAALAPGRCREMFDAFREGGPWKRDGGARRLGEDSCLSGLVFCSGFLVGDLGEVDISR